MNVSAPFTRILLLMSAVATGACARPAPDVAAEGEKLLRRDAEWADGASAGKDVDKVLSYFGEEALMIEPGQPVFEGKAAIRAYVASSFQTPGF